MVDPENNSPEELVLDEVVEVAPEELSGEQKTFLQENADNLTDEQKETYKEVLEEKEETPLSLDEIEPETRGGKPAPKKKEEKPEGEEIDEEDEIAPEDKETIGKVVKKELEPINEALKQVQGIKDQTEVDAFIRVKPEYSKYRDVVLKYMAHPSYANIPVHNIAAIVAAKDLQKMGADKEREAAKRAKETASGGQTQRKVTGGKVDWKTAPKEDFEAQKARVLGQG